MRGIVTSLVLALLVSAAAQAAERSVEGHVTRDGLRLEMTDGFAVRGPRGENVTVYLYPVAVSDRDMETTRAGQAWAVALRKPSPDPQRWDWCPTMEVDMQSVSGPLDGRSNLAFANFMFSGLERRNHTVNLTRSGDQARTTITELTFSEREGREYLTFTSRASGLSYDGRTEHAWQLQVTVPVLQAQPPAERQSGQ